MLFSVACHFIFFPLSFDKHIFHVFHVINVLILFFGICSFCVLLEMSFSTSRSWRCPLYYLLREFLFMFICRTIISLQLPTAYAWNRFQLLPWAETRFYRHHFFKRLSWPLSKAPSLYLRVHITCGSAFYFSMLYHSTVFILVPVSRYLNN